MASYPGSVKTFASHNAGDVIQPAHVNDLQDEVNAIEDGLLNGTARLNSSNSTIVSLFVTKALTGSVVTLTDGATVALDASLGNVFRLESSGDRTILTPTNATEGQKIIIQHYAPTTARTLALTTGDKAFRFGADVTSLTATSSGKTDYIGCVYNGQSSRWDVVAATKGF